MSGNLLEAIGLFRKSETECVAFDFGSAFIKGVYVDGNEIKRCLIEKNNGTPVKQAAAWLKKEGLLNREVRIAVKGADTLVRYIPFPRIDKKNFKEAFGYEIPKFVPFNKEDIYFDVDILDERYSANEVMVLLAVVKKKFLDNLIKQLQEEKIRVSEITLNNVSLLNLFLAHPPRVSDARTAKKEEPQDPAAKPSAAEQSAYDNAALIDVGLHTSLLNLIKKNQPCLSREIKVSAGDFLQKLVAVKNISPDEAQNYVIGLDSPREVAEIQEILEIIEEVAFELSEEVKNSLDYFELNWGQRIQVIYISGGLTKVKGIDRVMENSLGVPVRIWDPFESGSLILCNDAVKYKEMLAAAMGTALA